MSKRHTLALPHASARVLRRAHGGVVERLMAPVLKTGRAQALVGSNPTPSASYPVRRKIRRAHE